VCRCSRPSPSVKCCGTIPSTSRCVTVRSHTNRLTRSSRQRQWWIRSVSC
jgi:hypothetical protein